MASSSSRCAFSDPEYVKELTCSNSTIVELYFNGCDGRALYVHPAFLSAWSGVLRDLLEGLDLHEADTTSQHDQITKRRMQQGDQSSRYVTIPLDDTDTAAWEYAMALMHPCPQLFKVSWDSAASLLLLAHKYDMPAVTGEAHTHLCQVWCMSSGPTYCTCQREVQQTIWHTHIRSVPQICSSSLKTSTAMKSFQETTKQSWWHTLTHMFVAVQPMWRPS